MSLAIDPIARKELILDKIVIPGLAMLGGDGKGSHAASLHMHNYTRAFGDPERRGGLWLINTDAWAEFSLAENFAQYAYELKLLAMMDQWRNKSVELAIYLNEHLLSRSPMLFENVASGWPANFLALPTQFLRHGPNTIRLKNCSTGVRQEALFINQLDILIKPQDAAFQFELVPRIVRAGEPFFIRILNRTGKRITHQVQGAFKLVSHTRDHDEDVFEFLTPAIANDQSIAFAAAGSTLIYQPDRIVHTAQPYTTLVGTDFDDDRHDETTLSTLDFFHKTEMGNIIGFRPKPGRNCITIPSQDQFLAWFEFLKTRRMNFWVEDGAKRIPWANVKLARRFAPFLRASKFHEICNEMTDVANGLRDLKHAAAAFLQNIKQHRDSLALPGLPFWISSATMKILPAALSSDVDLPIAEPTSFDHMLLYSGLRRTAQLHRKPWGSHIALQWYLGSSHSHDKLCRFRTSLYMAYIFGAQLIYTESGLFKFVQFSQRRDIDHPFTRAARDILRDFYTFTRVQSIRGRPMASINLLYGNLDSFFFYPDHIPIDNNPSLGQRPLWYKWPRIEEDFGWLAAKNLFRPLNQSELKGYPGDTADNSWFSANPFGSVDIIPILDLAKNPLPLTFLLGRNIMTPAVHKQLVAYVKNGGTLFLTTHHFNNEPNPERPRKFFRNGDFTELCGFKLKSQTSPLGRIKVISNDILALPQSTYNLRFPGGAALQVFAITRRGSTILAQNAQSGAPLLVAKRLGKGLAICFTGHTTIGNPQLKTFVDDFIQALARQVRPEIHIANDAAVNLQEYRITEDAIPVSQLFLVNFNWKDGREIESAALAFAGKIFPLDVARTAPRILYRVDDLCFGAASPLTQIWDIRADSDSFRFKAAGRDLETFTLLFAGRPVTRVTCDGRELPFSRIAARNDLLAFSCELNSQREIILDRSYA